MALFNKDWNTYKENWKSGFSQEGAIGGLKSIFQTAVISPEQNKLLEEWNNLAVTACTDQEQFNKIIANADNDSKKYFKGLNQGKASMGDYARSLVGAKLATFVLQAASLALNAAISMGISLAIQGLITLFTNLITAKQRAAEKSAELAQKSAELAEKSMDNAEALIELKRQLVTGEKSTSELTNALKEQLKTMGYTETEINTLIQKYNGLAGAIDEATTEALESASVEANTARIKAAESLEAEYSDEANIFGSDDTLFSSGFDSKGLSAQTYEEVQRILEDSGKSGAGGYSEFVYGAQSDSAEDVYKYYQGLLEAKRVIEKEAKDSRNDDLLTSAFYNDLDNAINNLKESAEAYGEAINRLHEADAQLALADYLKTHSIKSKSDLDTYIKSIQDNKAYSEEYRQVLIGTANEAFPQFLDAVTETSTAIATSADNITLSLDQLSNASNSISSLSNAFNELSENGYISISSISSIKEAVGDSISNWDEYEKKLLSVKKGTAEYNQLISELTYATLEKQLGGVANLANASEEYIERILEENGVLNASTVAHDISVKAKTRSTLASMSLAAVTKEEIQALGLSEITTLKLSSAYSSAQLAMTKATQSGALTRLGITQKELEGVSTVSEAYKMLSGKEYEGYVGSEKIVRVLPNIESNIMLMFLL